MVLTFFLNGDGKVLEDLFIVLNKKLHLFVQFFLEKKKQQDFTQPLLLCVHIKFFILGLLRLEKNVNTKCFKGDSLFNPRRLYSPWTCHCV